ncbi:uncharacterized protein PV09_08598 [Verruconis gallopava]|uniref:Uncharacterized protein n=1 Tax=Verruconis gallopava TaxID=253628 RepID=A0A0D2AL53_9PEZI|nr:uncharacterized protein PV09_08598 [Verruconis gallopava]KIV99793.1 hypothetical protein PV09_08598 [Verruconis gallopava]
MLSAKWALPFLLALLSLLSQSLAASPTSFCKCTCFGNSTIIALSGTSSKDSSASKSEPKSHPGTCNDCNRKFCLDYNLPICKTAKEEDVVTTCFQRDSAKDEAVVFIFIFATTGLLVYAAIRPWVETWAERVRERRMYMPVSGVGVSEHHAGADES